jgi:hypothetical protein
MPVWSLCKPADDQCEIGVRKSVNQILLCKPCAGSQAVGTIKKVLASWGPGKYDAELNVDRRAMRSDGKSAATLIPPAFGLAGVSNHSWSGSRGSIPSWNAYVAVTQMRGSGTFIDRRRDIAANPVAAKTKLGETRGFPDEVTAKLARYTIISYRCPRPCRRRAASMARPRSVASSSSPARRNAPLAMCRRCLRSRDGTCPHMPKSVWMISRLSAVPANRAIAQPRCVAYSRTVRAGFTTMVDLQP